MDVSQKLDEITAVVGGARSMPMSASCVVNRNELLAMLEEAREALPGSLARAEELLGGRERVVAEAEEEARGIIESARAERTALVSGTDLARGAQEEADRILAAARKEAEEIRTEADDYVDSKLANFEVVLSKTIGSVERGREKLLGSGPGSEEWNEEYAEDAPERTADPQELRQRADTYVDARLGSVAAVLAKTLEAVGRGRSTLQGSRPADELAASMADWDESGNPLHTNDADYLAGLAAHAPEAEQAPVPSPEPGPVPVQQYTEPAPAPQPTADTYTTGDWYGQDAYAAQNGYYGTPGTDPYADPYAQGQAVGYGYQQQYPAQQPYPDQYQQQGYPVPPVPQQAPAGVPQADGRLDETSLFDTGMIDMDQVRRYEQEHGYGGR